MPIQDTPMINLPPKLLDQVRDQLRVKHYSIRTEHAYVDWIKRFIHSSGKHHWRHERPKIGFRFIAQRSMPVAPQDQARQVAAAYAHTQWR